jgi:hypothetical protein
MYGPTAYRHDDNLVLPKFSIEIGYTAGGRPKLVCTADGTDSIDVCDCEPYSTSSEVENP